MFPIKSHDTKRERKRERVKTDVVYLVLIVYMFFSCSRARALK